MTTTYDPFIPADGSHQHQYGGHRRAEGRDEGAGRVGEQRRPRAQEVSWQEDQRWEATPRQHRAEEPAQRWEGGEPRHREPQERHWAGTHHAGGESRREHAAGEPRWDQPSGEQHREYAAGEQRREYAAGEQRHEYAAREQRWDQASGEQRRDYAEQAQPRWHAGLAGGVPEVGESPPQRARLAGARLKPLLTGALVLLLLVVGWQAYRIEQMNSATDAMHSTIAAEQDRTARLEKELTGVFDPESVSSIVLPSVFRVRAGDFTGTAFSVGEKAVNGQANLLTNYHVVAEIYTEGQRKVSLERGSTRIDATIVKVSKGKDLALLRANQEIKGIGPSTAQVKPGQQVVVVGAPLGLDDTVTTGVISAWRPNDPDGPTIQFDAPINPGNSGGPVVNSTNQVVGLATAKAKDAEGIGLAIPIKTACETFGGIC